MRFQRELTAAVLIPIVLAILIKAPTWAFAALVGAATFVALIEFCGLISAAGWVVPRTAVLLLFVGFLVADFYSSLPVLVGLTGATLLILPTLVMFQKPDAQVLLPSAAASVFATLYVATGACAMIGLRAYSWQAVLFVLVVVWAGDSAAYYAGRKFGKKKLAPVVSPKKTWEGFWGQLAGGMLLGGLYVAVIPRTVSEGSSLGNVALAVAIALVLSVVAVIGDLVESTFKRSSGVKDSGGLLPGHGGLLDRLDSLLYSAPFVLLLVTVFPGALPR
ncbi:MAG: CDP-archaeol synthase [Acidobacteria bacterium]|nr:CDP-archaeol synthase [Acidobacteriota bacterium]